MNDTPINTVNTNARIISPEPIETALSTFKTSKEELDSIGEIIDPDAGFLSDNKNIIGAMEKEVELIKVRLENIISKTEKLKELIETSNNSI